MVLDFGQGVDFDGLYSESVLRLSHQISDNAFVSTALVDLSKLFDALEFDAAAVF